MAWLLHTLDALKNIFTPTTVDDSNQAVARYPSCRAVSYNLAWFYNILNTLKSILTSTPIDDSTQLEKEDHFQSGQPEKEDYFQKLSDDLILRILSHLKFANIIKRVSRVSHRFKRLALDTSLWTELKIPCEMDPIQAVALINQSPMLEKFNPSCRYDNLYLANYALQHCPKLVALDIWVTPDTLEALLEEIATQGGSLRTLAIRGIWNPPVLQSKATCLERLTHLHIGGTSLDDNGLIALAGCCSRLESFSMNAGEDVSDGALVYFLKAIQSTIKHLKVDLESPIISEPYAHLGGCMLLESLEVNRMFRTGLEVVVKLPKLTRLSIDRAYYMKSRDFLVAFGGIIGESKLKELSANGCNLKGTELRAIADSCPELTLLQVDVGCKVFNEDVLHVLERCPQMKLLHLRGMTNVTVQIQENLFSRCELRLSMMGKVESLFFSYVLPHPLLRGDWESNQIMPF